MTLDSGCEQNWTTETAVRVVADAVARARSAQRQWALTGFGLRRECVLRVRRHVVEHAEHIAEAVSGDNGKTRVDALGTEVLPCAMSAGYYARRAGRILARQRLRPDCLLFVNKRSYVDHVPYGVVGIIGPRNYPFSIPFHEVLAALIAGNGVVLKVASQTPSVGQALVEAFCAGGFPEGLFRLVAVPGAVAGDAFVEAGVDKLFFTGSEEVGRQLMAKAAQRLIPVALELGGNDAMIVCEDADLYRAAGGAAWAAFSNAGQSCAGVQRVFVESAAYDRFMAELSSIVKRLRVGNGGDFAVDVGPLASREQVAAIERDVRGAVQGGARVAVQSALPSDSDRGRFFPPTVLVDVDARSAVLRGETFGPVVAVIKVDSLNQAVAQANDSDMGLSASVWTRSRRTAHALAARLQVGAVTINDHMMSHGLPETPWGGFKRSGIGRTHGREGLEAMTQSRVVVDDALPGVRRNLWWYPYSRKLYAGLLGALAAFWGRSLVHRVRGGVRLAGLLPRVFSRRY